LLARAAVAAWLVLAWLVPAGAQTGARPAPVPLPDASGLSVVVPYRGGYVNVPLSSAAPPLAPGGAPAAPPPAPVPATPAVPSVPPAPGMPLPPAGAGFLRVEFEPPETQIIVDGHDAGPAVAPGAAARTVTLPAGVHRLELMRRGFQPLSVEVDIRPGQTSVLRWRLEAEPPAPSTGEGDGYRVIPPRATAPERPATGSGYFVVPRP
jgi:hypothetical protein